MTMGIPLNMHVNRRKNIMNKSQTNLKILLVCDNVADIDNIMLRLEDTIKSPCYVWHCTTLKEALDKLGKNNLRADIIILDLGLIGDTEPKEIYETMNAAAGGIPIIVLTGKGEEEHNLATFAMKAGAADNMIRGEFSGLTDAIEFALIRQDITKLAKLETTKALLNKENAKDEKLIESFEQKQKNRYEGQNILSMLKGRHITSNHSLKDK